MLANKKAVLMIAKALSSHPEAPSEPLEEMVCIAEAVYFEARGESVKGLYAVGRLVQNRKESSRYPDTFCQVVQQTKQFSYRNDGQPRVNLKSTAEPNAEALWWSVRVAIDISNNNIPDFLNGALHYFAHNTVKPSWYTGKELTQVIENHTYVVGVK